MRGRIERGLLGNVIERPRNGKRRARNPGPGSTSLSNRMHPCRIDPLEVAKLSWLGLIGHVIYLNIRYGGQHGWKLSSRFETALRRLADRWSVLRDKTTSSKEKNGMMLELMDARRAERACHE
jgi:hypothetical protein